MGISCPFAPSTVPQLSQCGIQARNHGVRASLYSPCGSCDPQLKPQHAGRGLFIPEGAVFVGSGCSPFSCAGMGRGHEWHIFLGGLSQLPPNNASRKEISSKADCWLLGHWPAPCPWPLDSSPGPLVWSPERTVLGLWSNGYCHLKVDAWLGNGGEVGRGEGRNSFLGPFYLPPLG